MSETFRARTPSRSAFSLQGVTMEKAVVCLMPSCWQTRVAALLTVVSESTDTLTLLPVSSCTVTSKSACACGTFADNGLLG